MKKNVINLSSVHQGTKKLFNYSLLTSVGLLALMNTAYGGVTYTTKVEPFISNIPSIKAPEDLNKIQITLDGCKKGSNCITGKTYTLIYDYEKKLPIGWDFEKINYFIYDDDLELMNDNSNITLFDWPSTPLTNLAIIAKVTLTPKNQIIKPKVQFTGYSGTETPKEELDFKCAPEIVTGATCTFKEDTTKRALPTGYEIDSKKLPLTLIIKNTNQNPNEVTLNIDETFIVPPDGENEAVLNIPLIPSERKITRKVQFTGVPASNLTGSQVGTLDFECSNGDKTDSVCTFKGVLNQVLPKGYVVDNTQPLKLNITDGVNNTSLNMGGTFKIPAEGTITAVLDVPLIAIKQNIDENIKFINVDGVNLDKSNPGKLDLNCPDGMVTNAKCTFKGITGQVLPDGYIIDPNKELVLTINGSTVKVGETFTIPPEGIKDATVNISLIPKKQIVNTKAQFTVNGTVLNNAEAKAQLNVNCAPDFVTNAKCTFSEDTSKRTIPTGYILDPNKEISLLINGKAFKMSDSFVVPAEGENNAILSIPLIKKQIAPANVTGKFEFKDGSKIIEGGRADFNKSCQVNDEGKTICIFVLSNIIYPPEYEATGSPIPIYEPAVAVSRSAMGTVIKNGNEYKLENAFTADTTVTINISVKKTQKDTLANANNVQPIPTLSEWMQILLMSLMAGSAVVASRRRSTENDDETAS